MAGILRRIAATSPDDMTSAPNASPSLTARRLAQVGLGFLLLITLTSCAAIGSQKARRLWKGPLVHSDKYGDTEQLPKDRFLLCNKSQTMAFVEFDEEGDFREFPADIKDAPKGGQLAAVVDDLRKKAQKEKVLLIVYIHGWKNSRTSGDVENFYKLTHSLTGAGSATAGDYHVYGVYLSWRGNLVKNTRIPLFDTLVMDTARQLTFWSRDAAAVRMGSISCTEALLRLAAAAKTNAHSKTVFVGHSFGAQALECAVAQATVSRVLEPRASGKPMTPPADLVVLLNQASASLTAKRFIDFLKREAKMGSLPAETPLIVSITSQTDNATRTFFPLGKAGTHLSGSRRRYDAQDGFPAQELQAKFLRTTPGHMTSLVSHDLTQVTSEPKPLTTGSLLDQGTEIFQAQDHHHWMLKRRAGAPNTSPYWIVRADKNFIRDHGDVWNLKVRDFLARIIRDASRHP